MSDALDNLLRSGDGDAARGARVDDGVVPPSVVATPSDVRAEPDERVNWWRPSWRDGVRHLGYRWLYLLPAAALLALGAWVLIAHRAMDILVLVGVKLLVVAGALAFGLATYAVREASRAHKDPFCIFCGYNLSNLPDDYRCPECGRHYTWALIAEYRRDPQWFIERWKAHRQLPTGQAAFLAGSVKRKRRARDGTE